jgi:hypothetical protein
MYHSFNHIQNVNKWADTQAHWCVIQSNDISQSIHRQIIHSWRVFQTHSWCNSTGMNLITKHLTQWKHKFIHQQCSLNSCKMYPHEYESNVTSSQLIQASKYQNLMFIRFIQDSIECTWFQMPDIGANSNIKVIHMRCWIKFIHTSIERQQSQW